MGTYNVHAGHCPQGQGASGAVGILQESVEDRIVKNEVIRLLRAEGNTVYDCTCDENTTASGSEMQPTQRRFGCEYPFKLWQKRRYWRRKNRRSGNI